MEEGRFVKKLLDELPKLVQAGALDELSAARVRLYYGLAEEKSPGSRLNLILSIFGSILIGGGVILLVAHNWEELSRAARAGIAFALLAAAQVVAGFALYDRTRFEGRAVREGVALGWMACVVACLAIVTQTYHLGGRIEEFVFACLLLTLPIVFLMESSASAAAFLLTLAWWGMAVHARVGAHFWAYYPLYAALAGFGLLAYRKDPASRLTGLLALALLVALPVTLMPLKEGFGRGVYLLLAAPGPLLLLAGSTQPDASPSPAHGAARGLGNLLLFMAVIGLSFSQVWEVRAADRALEPANAALLALLFAASVYALYGAVRGRFAVPRVAAAFPMVALLCTLLSGAGIDTMLVAGIINLFGLALGVEDVAAGLKGGEAGRVNRGMGLISLLILIRFVVSTESILIRGIAFILVGAAFLVVNRKVAAKAGREDG